MRRRDLIALVGRAVAAWPVCAYAQKPEQRSRMPHVGILNYAGAQYARVADFRDELRDLGYIEGQNLAVSHVWADGHLDRLPGLASQLIADKADIIIALGSSA